MEVETGSAILERLARVTGYGVRIAWFIHAMVEKLNENAHKRDWVEYSGGIPYFSRRVTQELGELRRAIAAKAPPEQVTREAADVANFAMMIADVYRHDYRA